MVLCGSQEDGCSLLALFEPGATLAAATSPGTSPTVPQASAGGHRDLRCEETLPAVSDSSC